MHQFQPYHSRESVWHCQAYLKVRELSLTQTVAVVVCLGRIKQALIVPSMTFGRTVTMVTFCCKCTNRRSPRRPRRKWNVMGVLFGICVLQYVITNIISPYHSWNTCKQSNKDFMVSMAMMQQQSCSLIALFKTSLLHVVINQIFI